MGVENTRGHLQEASIMAPTTNEAVTAEEFRQMADRAGLGMSQEELDDLKPMYDLYAQYTHLLHTIDLADEEIGVTFHPDWPADRPAI
jgi:hypothetical protein